MCWECKLTSFVQIQLTLDFIRLRESWKHVNVFFINKKTEAYPHDLRPNSTCINQSCHTNITYTTYHFWECTASIPTVNRNRQRTKKNTALFQESLHSLFLMLWSGREAYFRKKNIPKKKRTGYRTLRRTCHSVFLSSTLFGESLRCVIILSFGWDCIWIFLTYLGASCSSLMVFRF